MPRSSYSKKRPPDVGKTTTGNPAWPKKSNSMVRLSEGLCHWMYSRCIGEKRNRNLKRPQKNGRGGTPYLAFRRGPCYRCVLLSQYGATSRRFAVARVTLRRGKS